MVEENRKFLFKESDSSLAAIRTKSREVSLDIRKDQREKILSTKRFRNGKYESPINDQEHYNILKVKNTSKDFQKKSKKTHEQLKYLRDAFSYTGDFVDTFLEVDNALYTLVGYLTGNDSTLQLEAAWCITNISANDHNNMLIVVKATAPYLITYLQSGSVLLQDQSAWALGNMAADSSDVRDLLNNQGIVAPLINLLKSDTDGVVQSSLFALCNMSRSLELIQPVLLNTNLSECLLEKLSNKNTDINILSEVAWLLTYLLNNKSFLDLLIPNRILEHLTYWLCKVRPHQHEYFFAVTPLLRCLGNVIGSDADIQVHRIFCHENGLILQTLDSFLVSNKRYLIKECLWVISNLFASNINISEHSKEIATLLPNITRHLNSAYDIKKEAAICMCNLAFHGHLFLDLLINKSVFGLLMDFFKIPDLDIICIALQYFKLILPKEHATQLFYDMNGPSYLEALEYNEAEEIRIKAIHIQKTYYENDDDLSS